MMNDSDDHHVGPTVENPVLGTADPDSWVRRLALALLMPLLNLGGNSS